MRYVFQRGSLLRFVFSFLCILSFQPVMAAGVSDVGAIKSFREWKQSRIQEQEQRIQSLREQLGQPRRFAADDPNLSKKPGSEAGLRQELQDELAAEEQNLAISRDLSISDYFVGYLTKQPSLDSSIKEVSGRFTSEEVAELMAAYARHFHRTRPSSLKTPLRADSGL